MNKHLLLKSNIVIIIFILICFLFMIYMDASHYQQLTEEHIETIVQMANTDISRQLENSLNKEVAVAKSMANNTFLREWLENEQDNIDDEGYLDKLYQYLKTYQEAYHYATTFCVSAGSLNYYYQNGFNKTLTEGNEHDIWYFNFLDLNQEYDTQVDTDQVNNNIPTIFINYRMNDENGKLLAVLGVAVELTEVQNVIDTYADSYGLSIYLVNRGGAKNSFSQEEKYFVNENQIEEKLGVDVFELDNVNSNAVNWYDIEDNRVCVVNTYMDFLKWNSIVKKDTTSLLQSFEERILKNILICFGIVLGCIFVTSFVFLQYDKKKKYMENIDELTGLANRKIFITEMDRIMGKNAQKPYCLAMVDVDDFKRYNDTRGHLYGNRILTIIGKEINKLVGSDEIMARWGGDEFIGLMNGKPEEIRLRFQLLQKNLKNIERNEIITLSIGIIEIKEKLDSKDYVDKADQAMYQAKNSGKDTCVVI